MERNFSDYIRVSQVLGQLQDFSHIPSAVLERKQLIGTNIHAAIKQVAQGEIPFCFPDELGYMESFYKWRDIVQPTFRIAEERLYCDDKMLTGQIDALIKLQGEEESVLVDFKTSAQENGPIWQLQGHAYQYLLERNNYKTANFFLFVKLDSKGDLPKICRYSFSQALQDRFLRELEQYKLAISS